MRPPLAPSNRAAHARTADASALAVRREAALRIGGRRGQRLDNPLRMRRERALEVLERGSRVCRGHIGVSTLLGRWELWELPFEGHVAPVKQGGRKDQWRIGREREEMVAEMGDQPPIATADWLFPRESPTLDCLPINCLPLN